MLSLFTYWIPCENVVKVSSGRRNNFKLIVDLHHFIGLGQFSLKYLDLSHFCLQRTTDAFVIWFLLKQKQTTQLIFWFGGCRGEFWLVFFWMGFPAWQHRRLVITQSFQKIINCWTFLLCFKSFFLWLLFARPFLFNLYFFLGLKLEIKGRILKIGSFSPHRGISFVLMIASFFLIDVFIRTECAFDVELLLVIQRSSTKYNL